jgi:DNA-binding protein HU-beta
MNKAELIADVADKTGESKAKAGEFVDAMFQSIIDALIRGEEVKLPSFGSFQVVATAARVARNPQTNQEVRVPAGRRARFKPGKALKESLEAAQSGLAPGKS